MKKRMKLTWGLYSGDGFIVWFAKLIGAKLGKPDATFTDLYKKTKNELVITGTNLNRKMQRLFHRRSDPDMPIWLAVRISISIPLFFVPVYYQDCLYVDGTPAGPRADRDSYQTVSIGGLVTNFPLWVFGAHHIICPVSSD